MNEDMHICRCGLVDNNKMIIRKAFYAGGEHGGRLRVLQNIKTFLPERPSPISSHR